MNTNTSANTMKIELQPCCLKDLAVMYKVNRRTIKQWLEPFESEIGEKNGRFYTIKQVKIIFDKIGNPVSYVTID
jgi:hypothetical protein